MVKYQVTEIAGHARVQPIGAEGSVDFHACRARAEAARAEQVAKLVSGASRALTAGLAGLWRGYRAGQRKRAAIAQLAGLDDRMLRDIGLERGQIAAAVDGLMSDRDAVASDNLRP